MLAFVPSHLPNTRSLQSSHSPVVHSLQRPRLHHTKSSTRSLRLARIPVTSTMKVDAHVHIWDPSHPPHPEHPLPNVAASAATLVARMDAARINKAIVVQPINYKFDHTYLQTAVAAHPTRLYPVALSDTTKPPQDACKTLEHQVRHDGIRGIRINPTLASEAFDNPTVVALTQKAGELHIPVTLFARPSHLEQLENLLAACPDTDILLDHFAFCTTAQHPAAQTLLLQFAAKYPRLFIKTSAWFRLSTEPWPHSDLHNFLRALVSNFGASRLLFGSDFPFVTEMYDYTKAHSVLQGADFTPDERSWIAGRTAARLYKLDE